MRIRFLTLLILLALPAAGQNPVHSERDTINFDLWDYVCFDGTFSGKAQGRFIFDTGAGSTVIDSAFFASVYPNGMAGDSIMVLGVGNKLHRALFTRDTLHLRIGGVNCVSTKTAIFDLKSLLPNIDGILGVGIWGERPYMINYPDRHIVLLNSGDLERLQRRGYEKIPLLPSTENFLSVEMTMIFDSLRRKQIKTITHIDTGNPETLDLTPSVALRKQISEVSSGSITFDIATLGVGGGARFTLVKCQAIKIGNQTIQMNAFGIIENEDKDLARGSNGILGNEFMVHFDFAVDMAGRAIYLRPNKWAHKVARINYSGFLVSPTEGGYFVNGLSNKNTSVKQNDLITHIDNKAVYDLQWWDLNMFFTTADLGYTLRIIRDGEIKEIKIKNLNYKTLWR